MLISRLLKKSDAFLFSTLFYSNPIEITVKKWRNKT